MMFSLVNEEGWLIKSTGLSVVSPRVRTTRKRKRMYEYRAKVTRIIDGDTIDVDVDLGFDVWLKNRVRMYGMDTPSPRTRDKEEKYRGLLSKEYPKEALKGSKEVILKLKKVKKLVSLVEYLLRFGLMELTLNKKMTRRICCSIPDKVKTQ